MEGSELLAATRPLSLLPIEGNWHPFQSGLCTKFCALKNKPLINKPDSSEHHDSSS